MLPLDEAPLFFHAVLQSLSSPWPERHAAWPVLGRWVAHYASPEAMVFFSAAWLKQRKVMDRGMYFVVLQAACHWQTQVQRPLIRHDEHVRPDPVHPDPVYPDRAGGRVAHRMAR